MDATHANAELFAAISAAQAEVENATKNSNNPHFRSKYADLAEVLTTARPIYAKHGVSLVQSSGRLIDGQVIVTSVLAHKSGGYITTEASCIPAKTDAQGIGAATTYLRRFSAAALYCIAQEDDDGNTASGRSVPQEKQRVEPEQVRQEAKPRKAKQEASAQPEDSEWLPPQGLCEDCGSAKSKADWNQVYSRFLPYASGLSEIDKKCAWKWLLQQASKAGYRWDKDGAVFEPIAKSPEWL